MFSVVLVMRDDNRRSKVAQLIKSLEGFELVDEYSSVTAALPNLSRHGFVNFIFGDRQLDISEIEFANVLDEYCDEFVYVTKSTDVPLELFKRSGRSYLVEPVRVQKLLRKIARLSRVKARPLLSRPKRPNHIKAKPLRGDRDNWHKVFLKDIIRMYASGNHVNFETASGTYSKKGTLTDMEKRFCQDGEFNRIHQSHIVSKSEIQKVDENLVTLHNGDVYPISRSRKRAFNQFFYGEN